MKFSELRHNVGHIIGQAIGKGQFKTAINERDKSGAFRAKEQKDTLIEILSYLEQRDEPTQTEQPDIQ